MDKLAAKRIVIVGLGFQEQIDSQVIRRASATAARHLQQTGAHQISLAIQPEEFDLEESVRAEIEGSLLALYTFKNYKQSAATAPAITSLPSLSQPAHCTPLSHPHAHSLHTTSATNL